MSFTIKFLKPEMKGSYDWQLIQEINVLNEDSIVVAKAEIELITLNKHRDALKSYELIEAEEDGATDWELPLNLYFKGQNLTAKLCEELSIKPDIKKAKTHILLDAISVLPNYQKQGIAKLLLKAIAEHYPKIQSLMVLTMPLSLFLDADACELEASKIYYQQLDLQNDKTTREALSEFFQHCGFIEYKVDETLLNEPLAFDLFITTPDKLNGL